jgi:hypothetical protein
MPLKIEKLKSEIEDHQSELSPFKIFAYPADYTLEVLHDKWKHRTVRIPPTQRHFVWTVVQASRLVESFLLGLPVPGIFLYKDKETEELLVIDGQQRLRSVFGFFEGSVPDSKQEFSLRGVQPTWEGQSFQQLRKKERQRLKDSVLRATIVDQIDPEDNTSIIHIFERLNTGGTSLQPQEVRNCTCSGPFNELLNKLNLRAQWRALVGSERTDRRMRDVELVLRFLALARGAEQYSKPMKNFLSDFMKRNRFAPQDRLAQFEKLFVDTVQKVVQHLAQKPFHVRAGLNAAVYDSVMTAFAQRQTPPPQDVRARYKKLLRNRAFREYTSSGTTDVDVVRKRMALAKRKLFGE